MFRAMYLAADQCPAVRRALIAGQWTAARVALAYHVRRFRHDGRRDLARSLLDYAAWISYPVRLRPNGRYR